MVSFPYYSHIFRDSSGSGMGIVWVRGPIIWYPPLFRIDAFQASPFHYWSGVMMKYHPNNALQVVWGEIPPNHYRFALFDPPPGFSIFPVCSRQLLCLASYVVLKSKTAWSPQPSDSSRSLDVLRVKAKNLSHEKRKRPETFHEILVVQ